MEISHSRSQFLLYHCSMKQTTWGIFINVFIDLLKCNTLTCMPTKGFGTLKREQQGMTLFELRILLAFYGIDIYKNRIENKLQ